MSRYGFRISREELRDIGWTLGPELRLFVEPGYVTPGYFEDTH